jgi:diaminohydroxyphosphoribosylaminopyrimidine deaminase/5-amino-6-(5-phosphoribosylamino)uracil reductase
VSPAASAAEDVRWMRRCLALARRAEGHASPNPIVGCVIVGANGEKLAEGWHRRAGEPHAEADALTQLAQRGKSAKGATAYVNLEPCGHTGARRTAPCAPKLVAAGVKRLVYGMVDPFPGHGGNDVLLEAGVRVDGPILGDECRRANAAFATYATLGRAHLTLKVAMSLDGRIATRTGESQWITGEASRAFAHRLRAVCDGILVGARTVAADDPLLTCRGVKNGRDPVRIVLDGKLSMSPRARMLRSGSSAPTWIACTADAPAARMRALEDAGAVVLKIRGKDGKVDMRALLGVLGKRGVISVLVEGGAETHGAFLDTGLCDRLYVAMAPMAIGGRSAPSWLGGEGVARLARAPRFRPVGAPIRLDDDFLFEFEKL